MADDPGKTREILFFLDEIEKDLDLLKRKIQLLKRDLRAELNDTKPAAQQLDQYIGAGGKRFDLRKYRFPAKGGRGR